ncbi:MAG: bifunctional diaminohydroxyphosphoribosylaminopyrimidine deaminase/5-amino-6-(5-phosphoribosylamino)uracil reductase RibD [Lachnospiraceae bacterium]|nr:bifunctional diaminohydroxyphosphoribosylaminopyrimidine deaminase/5-amino-6-(5-phosphoribosylamino)uracil reductase RibD [Lachnospiraceae bacterium]
MKQHEQYMRHALALAKKAEGYTNPNPMVGCVIVKDGRIIGEGYHERCGQLHAERNAFLHCTEDTVGADLYVTLEPCCHYGKTPPCTEAIIEHKIARVFVACLDPNPLVAGKGIGILRNHGIEVITGILEEECRKVNEVFFHYIQGKLPFVAMKYAMTLDGKIAAYTGDSKWVTGEAARRHTHGLRKKYKGIMVGIGTVLADDPMLNCRTAEGADPIRIVCDSHLRLPMESNLVKTAQQIPVIAVYTDADTEKITALTQAGVTCLAVGKSANGKIDLKEMLTKLGAMNIDGILVEGGGTLNASLIEQKLVHRVYAYVAPKIIGGGTALSPVEGEGIDKMCDAITLSDIEILTLGADICITGRADG